MNQRTNKRECTCTCGGGNSNGSSNNNGSGGMAAPVLGTSRPDEDAPPSALNTKNASAQAALEKLVQD